MFILLDVNVNLIILLSSSGLDIVENGITFVTDFTGRRSGEAFVQFSSHQEAVEALQKDREFIGNR